MHDCVRLRGMSSSRASVLASLANLRHRSLAKRLAQGLRAPAAVSIAALTESAQNLTPIKNLRNAQLLYDELIARRASMVACMLRLPEEIREQAHVAALTEARDSGATMPPANPPAEQPPAEQPPEEA